MTLSTKDMHAAVEEAARVHLAEHGRLLAVTPLHSSGRTYSKMHRMELRFEKGTLDVCIKLHLRDDPSLEQECVTWAREEFAVLKALYAAARDARELSVVRPLAFLPQLPGILLETHHGTVLNTLLKERTLGPWRRRSVESLESYYGKLGVSLREFHDLTTGNPDLVKALAALSLFTYSADQLLEEADDGFQRAMSLSPNGNHASAERLYGLSREGFSRVVRADYRRVGVHGDFTPVNIFVHGTQTTVYDFVNLHYGHPYEDLSRFISYTYFVQKDPLALRRKDVIRLIAAFMDGYGLSEWRVDPVLSFFFQKSMFRTLRGGFRFAKRPGLLRAIYRRAMLSVFHAWVRDGMRVPS